MIIVRTPFRVSFAGGGSDLANYYEKYGGAVLSTAINKYNYLCMHPYFFKDGYFLKYSQTELVDDVNDIKHNIIREVFKLYNIRGVDLNSSADIPSGTGLSSSSAFTAGLIHLCNAYNETYMTKEEIAEQACHVEIDLLNEPIGKQDQYACACGGLNFIEFEKSGKVNLEKVYLTTEGYERLENNLLLFYTGQTRAAGNILKEQKKTPPTTRRKSKICIKWFSWPGICGKNFSATTLMPWAKFCAATGNSNGNWPAASPTILSTAAMNWPSRPEPKAANCSAPAAEALCCFTSRNKTTSAYATLSRI